MRVGERGRGALPVPGDERAVVGDAGEDVPGASGPCPMKRLLGRVGGLLGGMLGRTGTEMRGRYVEQVESSHI